MKWVVGVVLLVVVAVIAVLHIKKNKEIEAISHFQDNCSAYLKSLLLSPGSLKVVKAYENDWVTGRKEVSIEFDSENQFGALLRGQIRCSYMSKLKWWTNIPDDVDLITNRAGFEAYELRPFKIQFNDETIGGDPINNNEIKMISTRPMLLLLEREHERAKRKADIF